MRIGSRSTRCAFVVAAMVGIGQAVHVQSPSPLLVPAPPVSIGPGPGQVVLVDVNQDGRLDMVTRHLLQKRVAILRGDGKGGFTPAAGSPMTLDYQPGWVEAADVNGDTSPDLAVSKSERDEVDLFLGDRTGAFTRAAGSPFTVSPSTEFYTRGLYLADVNHDRRVDILAANGRENSIGILFGDGQGRFSPGPTLRREPRGRRYTFAFGDVDGDGNVDAVVAGRANEDMPEPGRVSILRGDGKGGFAEMGPPLTVAPGPHFATLADIDGDQRLDLVITHSGNLLSVLLNDGRGTFKNSPGSPFDSRTDAFAVVVADVDGDKRADILAATGSSALVFLGDGRGGFAPAAGSPFPAGPGAYQLAVGDINDDGKLDVAAASFDGNAVTVLLQR